MNNITTNSFLLVIVLLLIGDIFFIEMPILDKRAELKNACEANLPRDQKCKMVFIPATQDMYEVTK